MTDPGLWVVKDGHWHRKGVQGPATDGGGDPSSGYKVFANSEGAGFSQQTKDFDGWIAAAESTTTPLLQGAHTYSGNSWPSTFADTTMQTMYDYGFPEGVLNVKCDWATLANGGLDAHAATFLDSIPSDFKLYLVINHEPENDSDPDGHGAWQDGQARMANLIASRDNENCYFSVCLMSFTWLAASGRTPNDWNPADAPNITMTQAALDRTVFGPDNYVHLLGTDPLEYSGLVAERGNMWDDIRGWGFSRLALNEVGVTNASTYGLTDSGMNTILNEDMIPTMNAVDGMEYIAFYSSAGTSGTGFVITESTPLSLQTFADYTYAHNR